MHSRAVGWLETLPSTLSPLKRTVENIKDPLYRFMEREVNSGLKLLTVVRTDLEDVVAITGSGKKQTNHHRNLVKQLTRGIIPKNWLQYKVKLSLFPPFLLLSVPVDLPRCRPTPA